MNRNAGWLWGSLLGAMIVAGSAAAGERALTIPRVEKGPRLTGSLSDPLWRKGAPADEFSSILDEKPADAATSARVLRDGDFLYIGFRCEEPSGKPLVAKVVERDGPVYRDDCVEVFLDTNRDRDSYCHFIVNSRGVVLDERGRKSGGYDDRWNADLRVKTGIFPGYWVVEMAIPFNSPAGRALDVNPVVGDRWGMNLCRERYAGEKEFTCWAPSPGTFQKPDRFGEVRFGGTPLSDSFDFDVESWGELRADSNEGGGNTFRAVVRNRMISRSATLEARLNQRVGGKWHVELSTPLEVGEQASAEITLPYAVKGESGERFAVTVVDSENNQTVFRTERPVSLARVRGRVWQVKEPLYEELLSPTPPGDQKEGAIYWFHSGIYSDLRPFALCYGLRYSYEEAIKELVDKKLMIIVSPGMIEQYELAEWHKKYPFKALLEPDYRGGAKSGAPVLDGFPFFLDPLCQEAYFKTLRENLTQYKGMIWGIYSYDEPWEKTCEMGVKFFETRKDSYAFIREADKQVREQYGAGRYGIPTSMSDTNPYRWIAYRRWVNEQIVKMHQKIREEAKEIDPAVRIISMDPVAGHKPYAMDQVGASCDLITHQLYPVGNPDLCEFGFTTKLEVDLTGKPVWPCAHVERYAYSTNLDEVRELMSQVLRNGGKGFHLYIPDVTGKGKAGDTKITRFGAPDRYRAIMETVALTAKSNEVKLPAKADAAMLYSEDTYQSFPAPDNVFPDQIQYAYTFFGPVAERWFKIVNENVVDSAPLASYRALVAPLAKYERQSTARKIAAWVSAGGTLICGDPEAFSADPVGGSLSEIRAALKLPALGAKRTATSVKLAASPLLPGVAAGTQLPVFGASFRITPAPGATVLARFADGAPAIAQTKVGKGRVIACAFNPFALKGVSDDGWKRFFTALSDGLGLRRESIWRFELPRSRTAVAPKPVGACLTGNSIRWQMDEPTTEADEPQTGSYRYSVEPDAIRDRASGTIPFAQGKLTDRLRAVAAEPKDLTPANFAVAWDRPEAVEIVFDLGVAREILRSRFWFTGKLPAVQMLGSADGASWQAIADLPEAPATEDTLDQVLVATEKKACRFVKLSFGPRVSGQRFTLGEVEVWGAK